ncbi:hypothetical protein G3480_24845 [Thiorhodococcus mannitoliphagus]|uniref:Uncharacterized protein n=1 Tax=Thiorhodococcus mannitoliphagus TaxID=329406 RepID=A0A6P1DYS4_9GAMM|nr:hypothetical protein [Thiorhodococcus mannitoliphagus]NEX23477.1 hypothetical protein [Thiorhodococcus mannitoliphagus]
MFIGDLRDLTKQGLHWARGEETDEVIAALATIGVVASAAQLASGQDSRCRLAQTHGPLRRDLR